jgi:alpha-D-ribose 1-methylphosphonate 5-triphosphate synthase subunit PhnH
MSLELQGGFTDAPRDSAHAFRAVMEAMARPGRIATQTGATATAPAPVSPAAATVLLTLCDPDTPLWLAPSHDSAPLRAWLAFHTGAPLAGPQDCRFALGTWPALHPVERFAIGTPEYPDRSATLIVEQPTLLNEGPALSGPGIREQARLNLPETHAFQRNAALYPLGFDCLFTSGNRLAALPRSTRIG